MKPPKLFLERSANMQLSTFARAGPQYIVSGFAGGEMQFLLEIKMAEEQRGS